MAPSLLRPPGHFNPAEALQLAQQAPTILQNNPKAFSSSPLGSLFTAAETPEIWIVYENLLLACLRTGDSTAAHDCLERLVRRFGGENDRIMALKGLVKEADADNNGALEVVLNEYDALLADNGANIPIAKRRVVILRSLGRIGEAIGALTSLLETSPTDSEAWAELSDLYLSQGLYSQAVYALEEVLVLAPNSWNMHARLGEVLYMAAIASPDTDGAQQQLAESLKRFCRSIELCDDYLRGHYGLKTVSDRLLAAPPTKAGKRNDVDVVTLPEPATIERLNQLATERLAEIVRRYAAKEPLWQGYEEAEVAAARALLDKSTASVAK
jgi:tetratricopeptide (TPR) repeat protein